MKHYSEQGFVHNLFHFDWERIDRIADMRSEVHKSLIPLDTRNSAGSDDLESLFLKLPDDSTASPVTYLFNLSLDTNEITTIWKFVFPHPLLKGPPPNYLLLLTS